MDKFYIKEEYVEQFIRSNGRRKYIRFPVNLAVKYSDYKVEDYSNFVLNASKGGVFIKTERPLEKHSRIVMCFYIPPEEKLLGKFEGEVVSVNNNDSYYPKGMHIKLIHHNKEDMQRLEDFLEEKRRLIDITA